MLPDTYPIGTLCRLRRPARATDGTFIDLQTVLRLVSAATPRGVTVGRLESEAGQVLFLTARELKRHTRIISRDELVSPLNPILKNGECS